MGKSRQDDELTELLTKLYTIQEDIGAKPASTEEEKKNKAENIATMGKAGTKAAQKGSRFLELKSTIVDRLKSIHRLLKDTKEKETAGYGGDNAKEIIKMQAEVRENLRQATEEWKEMDAIYKKEARKKKSKFTVEELEVQQELVRRLHAEIEKIKEAQMRGYSKTRDTGGAAANTKALYTDSISAGRGGSKGTAWSGGGGGVAMSDDQKQQMAQIEERDKEFDRDLDEIGEGIQDLAEIATMQGEEVKRQAVMLENVNAKMDKVNERMLGVNDKMKQTLEEVGRSSDKLVIDIVCVLITIGMAAMFYQISKMAGQGNNDK
jgi:SYP7 family syntaxin